VICVPTYFCAFSLGSCAYMIEMILYLTVSDNFQVKAVLCLSTLLNSVGDTAINFRCFSSKFTIVVFHVHMIWIS